MQRLPGVDPDLNLPGGHQVVEGPERGTVLRGGEPAGELLAQVLHQLRLGILGLLPASRIVGLTVDLALEVVHQGIVLTGHDHADEQPDDRRLAIPESRES